MTFDTPMDASVMIYNNDKKLTDNKTTVIYKNKFKKKANYIEQDPVEYIKTHKTGHEAFYGACSAYFDFDDAVYATQDEQKRNKIHDMRLAIEMSVASLRLKKMNALCSWRQG